jgi:hypothetical protein
LLWGIAIHLPSEDGAGVFDGISRIDIITPNLDMLRQVIYFMSL